MERLKILDEVPNDNNDLQDFLRETPLDANDMENEDFDLAMDMVRILLAKIQDEWCGIAK